MTLTNALLRTLTFAVVCLLGHSLRSSLSGLILTCFVPSTLAFRSINRHVVRGGLVVNSVEGKGKPKEEELAEMVAGIMKAVDEGREEDLKLAGLRVTQKSDLERMRDNLENAQIVESVLGNMSGEEEQEILRALERTKATMGVVGFDDSSGVDNELLAEFRAEAVQAMRNLQNSDISILDSPSPNSKASAPESQVHKSARILSPVESGGDAPPSYGRSREMEIDPSELEADPLPTALAEESSPAESVVSSFPETSEKSVADSMAAIEAESGLSGEDGLAARGLAQQTFAQLLKASMDVSEDRAAEMEDETRKKTLEAVSSGDLSNLDITSLLGETLGTLAEQMGIDVRSELATDKTKADMQQIMASSMAELVSNMAELDEQSQMLYQKLGNLEEELRKETAAFEEQKSSELEGLLGRQAALQTDIESSREQVQATAAQLEKLMSDLDDRADLLTALALFPIKSIDKKAAFVLGLSLALKVPYDALQLFAVRSMDASDMLGLVVQAGLCVAFFNHYGLVRALFQPKTSFLPPPPPPEKM